MATKTKQISLEVLLQEGDFQISCADALQVKAGSNVGFSISVVPLLGFSGSVVFSIAGGPAGMIIEWPAGDTWTPAFVGNLQCNLSIPLDNSLIGTYPLTLTGTY